MGIAYFGPNVDAARVVWMDGTDTIYDGVEARPFYSRESLDDDIAAADLIVATIRSPEVIATVDSELIDALKHVRAAKHLNSDAPKDWLSWLVDRLAEVPTLPQLNAHRHTARRLSVGKTGVWLVAASAARSKGAPFPRFYLFVGRCSHPRALLGCPHPGRWQDGQPTALPREHSFARLAR